MNLNPFKNFNQMLTQVWKDVLVWLSSLQSGSVRKLPCMDGWVISINSLLSLWQELHDNHDIKLFFTKRLNQDCLQNLFSVIRGKGGGGRGHIDNPSATEFRQFLRQVMVDSVLLQSDLSNCEEDNDHFILDLETLKSQHTPLPALEDVPLPLHHQDDDNAALIALAFAIPFQDEVSIEEANILAYIAGFITRKLQKKVCPDCQSVLRGSVDENRRDLTFLQRKQLPDLKGEGLFIPSRALVQVLESLEMVFNNSEQLLHMDRVRERFILRLDKEAASVGLLRRPSGQCPLRSLVVHRFTTIRLHFALKENNRQFAAASKRQNRKLLKLEHIWLFGWERERERERAWVSVCVHVYIECVHTYMLVCSMGGG